MQPDNPTVPNLMPMSNRPRSSRSVLRWPHDCHRIIRAELSPARLSVHPVRFTNHQTPTRTPNRAKFSHTRPILGRRHGPCVDAIELVSPPCSQSPPLTPRALIRICRHITRSSLGHRCRSRHIGRRAFPIVRGTAESIRPAVAALGARATSDRTGKLNSSPPLSPETRGCQSLV